MILYFVVLVFSVFFMTYAHEDVHSEIFRSYGINSTIVKEWGWFPIATRPEEVCSANECTLAHDINEVVGYQLTPFMFLIWFLALILNLTIVVINHDKQETLNNLLEVLISK